MKQITLHNLLPRIFRDDPGHTRGQIWSQPTVTFARPATYMIEAESGTGKSTLCAYLYGTRADYDGQILFDGQDTRQLTIDDWCRLRRETLAYLPQDMRLFPEMTALQNILIKNRLTDYYTAAQINLLLDRLELSHKANQPVGQLSIGQQQRIAILRALSQPYDFLIVDEPVSHLDQRNNHIVATLISEATAQRQATVIATSVGNPLNLPTHTPLTL